ncbi:MAG: hypothetical protein LAN18_01430 [Acidobacteriia bacterium]|nr:hypothetical protein [Terriglobia bacterium]
MKTTLRPHFKTRTKFAFASTTLLLSLSLVFTPVRSAEQPSLLYATLPFSPASQLAAFSLEANRVRVIGKIGYPLSAALAFCPPGGVPYAITDFFDPTTAQLATLNLGAGAATLVGLPWGQALSIMGMACSRDGTLYAVGQADTTKPDTFNSLYTVNRETGFASPIGSTEVKDSSDPSGFSGFFMALAFAPNGTLYGVNSTSTLFSIDLTSGLATKVVALVHSASGGPLVPLMGVMGLAIDSDGNFYVSDFVASSSIYALDVSTGVATPILNTGLAFVHNIAFKTPG